MDLTKSYEDAFDAEILQKFTWLETRNAAAVFKASNPEEFSDLTHVLGEFRVYDSDLLIPGGNRGRVSVRLDAALEARGWRAVRINMKTSLVGKAKSSSLSRGPYLEEFLNSEVSNEGYEVDNMKRRAAIDVEWNGKDGALDRDTGAYRALYDLGLIDIATIITRDHEGIKRLLTNELHSEDAARRLGTTTTTNMAKLRDRMARGDSGGCPVLAVGITQSTWAGAGAIAPELTDDARAALEVDAEQSTLANDGE